MQNSVELRNARLDAIETLLGASAKLQVYSGAAPANTATAASGTKLIEITLAADWAAAAANGSKALSGVPLATTALAGGTVGYYRFVTSGGTCHTQGPASATGGGGELTVDNALLVSGQNVSITGFVWSEGGS